MRPLVKAAIMLVILTLYLGYFFLIVGDTSHPTSEVAAICGENHSCIQSYNSGFMVYAIISLISIGVLIWKTRKSDPYFKKNKLLPTNEKKDDSIKDIFTLIIFVNFLFVFAILGSANNDWGTIIFTLIGFGITELVIFFVYRKLVGSDYDKFKFKL